MANWYYYDNIRDKTGPITASTLRELARIGVITPDTILETDDGKRAPAIKVKGLEFPTRSVPPTALPELQSPNSHHSPPTRSPKRQVVEKVCGVFVVIIFCCVVAYVWHLIHLDQLEIKMRQDREMLHRQAELDNFNRQWKDRLELNKLQNKHAQEQLDIQLGRPRRSP